MRLPAFRTSEKFVVVCTSLSPAPGSKWVEFQYVGGELSILGRREFSTWEECANPKNLPIILSIHGKGVVDRSIDQVTEPNEALKQAFPTTEPGSLVGSWATTDTGMNVSAARTEQVERLINLATTRGYRVVEVQLGTGHLLSLLPLIDVANERMDGSPWQIGTNGAIEGRINIGGQTVEDQEILAFATAVRHLTGRTDTLGGSLHSLQAGRTEERFRRIHRRLVKYAVAACMLLTIGTLVARRSLNHRYERALQASLADQGQARVAREVQGEIAIREAMLNLSGSEKELRAGLMADRLSAMIPATVRLTRMAIAPAAEAKNGTDLLLYPDSVVLEGVVPDPIELNGLVHTIKNEEFVAAAHVRNVSRQPRSSLAAFTIEISTR